jgi:hypothetical protein
VLRFQQLGDALVALAIVHVGQPVKCGRALPEAGGARKQERMAI